MKQYTQLQKQEIVQYLSNHTYIETQEKFGTSPVTLSRWSKEFGLPQKKKNFELTNLLIKDEKKFLLKCILTYMQEKKDIEIAKSISKKLGLV